MSVARRIAGTALGLVVLAGCGGGDEGTDCDPIAATLISRIEVAPLTATLADGESVQLAATAYSCDGGRLDATSFTWQSADASTVSVGAAGMAAAVKLGGPVMVTATAQGKQGAASISVTPRAVASVRVEPATATVAAGRTSTLVAKAFDAQGGELPGRSAVWSSSNPGVVAVSPAGAISGVAVGGPTTITAAIEGKAGTAQVTVVSAAVASITVSPPVSTIPAGSTVQLQAVLRDDQGNVLTGRALLWSTSDPARTTVSAAGLVTGTAPGGPVAILATSEQRSGSAQVTVSALPLDITTTTLPRGTVGVPYSQAVSATGGVQPYSWTVASGALPPGLTLSSAGVLSGTPTTDGNFAFTLRLRDAASITATRALTLQVGAGLDISTASVAAAVTGAAYSQQLAATGGTTPYSWTLASGTLPTGLTLSATGVISGTPTVAGSSSFTVRVADAAAQTDEQALTLSVSAALAITTTSLPEAIAWATYSQQLVAAGGSTPYSWTLAGTLPSGLTLSAEGLVSGTPTAAGSSSFTVRVADAASQSDTQALTLSVGAALAITTTSLPEAIAGADYSQQLAATGGRTPYSWTLASGTLPAGLTLSATGAVSGTPTAAGSSTFTVRVSDTSAQSETRELLLVVGTALGITTTGLSAATVGVSYSEQLAATGGTPPYSWAIASGALPVGVTLGAGGALSGTPSESGSFSFTAQVSDGAASSATQGLTLNVSAPLGVLTTSVPAATAGTAYFETLGATGGTPPYTWTIASGSLPSGLLLSSAGVLSGTPTVAGSSTFTIQVSDPEARIATQGLTVTVVAGAPAQIIWVRQPPDVGVNDAISPAPSVRVQDGAGNLVTAAVPVTMSVTRPDGRTFTVPSITTVSTAGGIATFDDLRISSTSNSFRMRASAGGIQSPESENFRVR